MHVAGREKIKSGYRDAENRMVHHGGSFEHVPAMAWAASGDRYLAIMASDHPGLEPHQLRQKCEAMLRKGAGF